MKKPGRFMCGSLYALGSGQWPYILGRRAEDFNIVGRGIPRGPSDQLHRELRQGLVSLCITKIEPWARRQLWGVAEHD